MRPGFDDDGIISRRGSRGVASVGFGRDAWRWRRTGAQESRPDGHRTIVQKLAAANQFAWG
jgi:hypothetical protein